MLRNKVKDLGNEKKMLITRLMQISLLVDDHVYNDKRIPATDAHAHIAELSSYDIRKYSDVRISQVTEKLIRCMKRIIIEEQEGVGLATYVSESIDKVSNTNNIINLPSHSEFNIHCNVTTLVDIENRNENINNISAKTPTENKLDSDPNENVAENVIDDIPIDKYQDVLHNIPIITEHEVVNNTTKEFKNKPGTHEVVETESKNDLLSESLCEKNNKDIKNKFNLKKERKKRSSKSKVEKKVEQKEKVSKPRIKKNKCTQKTKKDKLKNTVTSIEPKVLQERTEFDKNSVDHLVTNANTETLKNTSKMIIYKKSTVDDLSWIEDIRYVREKDSEEFDLKSNILEDVFWNDCTLPPNLSEEDFML